MRCRAELKFTYESESKAGMAAELLEIDNRLAPRELSIVSSAQGRKVTTLARHTRLPTLAATLEDVIFTEKLISEILEL